MSIKVRQLTNEEIVDLLIAQGKLRPEDRETVLRNGPYLSYDPDKVPLLKHLSGLKKSKDE